MNAAPDCANDVDLMTLGQPPGTDVVCGCGGCPEPDPTPAELQARVEFEAWERAASTE